MGGEASEMFYNDYLQELRKAYSADKIKGNWCCVWWANSDMLLVTSINTALPYLNPTHVNPRVQLGQDYKVPLTTGSCAQTNSCSRTPKNLLLALASRIFSYTDHKRLASRTLANSTLVFCQLLGICRHDGLSLTLELWNFCLASSWNQENSITMDNFLKFQTASLERTCRFASRTMVQWLFN